MALVTDYRNAVLALRPLGYWRLGEASGTVAADEMLRNDGTYNNTPTLGVTGALTGDSDTAITLASASSEDANMGDVLSFDYNEPFSVAVWFKANAVAAYSTLVSKLLSSGTKRGWAVYMDPTGAIEFELINTISTKDLVVGTTADFDDNAWHMAVVTYSGNNLVSGVTIYIDGVSEALTTVRDILGANTTVSTAPLCVGSRNNTNLYFTGSLDEAAVFDYELTAKDVAAMYHKGKDRSGYEYEVLKLAPQSYWRLGEASGTTAADEVGANDGTYNSSPTLGAASLVPADVVDKAVTLNGTNNYVTMGNVLNFAHNKPFSFCFWVKSSDDTGTYLSKYNPSTPKGFTFHTNGAQLAFIWRTTTTSNEMKIFYNASTQLWDGAAHMVVVTYDGSTNAAGVNVYIDTLTQAPTVGSDTLSSAPGITTPFQLGAQNSSNLLLAGTMDEVAVFDTELSQSEVRRLYSYGLALLADDGYAREVLYLNPVGYWRLGEASGTTAADELGLNDGTYNNTPTLGVTGALTNDADKAITLAAASSEDANMGNVLDFNYNDPFSLVVWFKTTSATHQVLAGKMEIGSGYTGYNIAVSATGTIWFELVNTTSTTDLVTNTTAATFADGAWHMAVVTYNGNNLDSGVTIYVDSAVEAKTNVRDGLGANSTLNPGAFCVGSRNSTDSYATASVDEVAVFDYELTAREVRRLYERGKDRTQYNLFNMEKDVLGYWRLSDAGPTTAVDETGNQNATGVNTPLFSAASLLPNESANKAVDLERTNSEHFTVGTTDIVSKKANQTIMAWVKFEDTGVQQRIWQESDGSSRYAFFVDATGKLDLYIDHGATTNVVGATTLASGRVYFLAATLDATAGTKVFVNGIVDGSDANTTAATATMTGVQIGAKLVGGNVYFDGIIDEVAVLQEALTETEIQEAFIAGLLSYAAAGGGTQYNEAVTDAATMAALLGASADHLLSDATAVVTVLATHWGKTVTEAVSFEVGLGIINTIQDTVATSSSTATIRNQIGLVVESVQFALTENIEAAKGIVEGLALNEVWVGGMKLQGTISESLSYADVIMLTWDQLQTEALNVTGTGSAYIRKGAALAELFVSAGLVSTIHKAAGIIAEAMILQDLAERYFELSATDGIVLTDAEATVYRAVAANIESAALADSIAGGLRLSLLVSDTLTGSDTTSPSQRLQAALADGAVFGGAITLPDGVFSAIVLNTESLGISEYANYPFNSFGKLGNDYLGASDTDIYKLTGSDDAGTDIAAVIRTGMTNFGSNIFKRVPRAYLGYTSNGGMIMKTISTSGGVKTERWYELTPRTGNNASTAHAAARIKLGRGIKATYWQFELINKLGSDFDIDSLQLYPMILKRRV